VKEIRKLLRGSLPSSIEIKEEIDPECRPIMADGSQIHQVIMNLCTNAFQAMEGMDTGVLRLELAEVEVAVKSPTEFGDLDPGMYVRFSVSDNGVGMDEEVQRRIFEPYFTTKGIGSGTGLGLATVHGIVKSHGGEITVSSALGEGSAFHVYLPVCQTGGQGGITNGSRASLPKGDERILFVDDEEMIVDSAERSLERLGYTVETCANGEEALRLFLRDPSRFDAVITDLTMPKMTGTRLAREILKTRPDIPVILCTGYSEKLDLSTAKERGFAELLRKPIDAQVLATVLRQVLDRAPDPASRVN
jgi:CheY-like chemotaxis protein